MSLNIEIFRTSVDAAASTSFLLTGTSGIIYRGDDAGHCREVHVGPSGVVSMLFLAKTSELCVLTEDFQLTRYSIHEQALLLSNKVILRSAYSKDKNQLLITG